METKPYNIQSPEAIAKEYGGNKQKIAQAMQMGVVDPTAGVLAGMFIDRMRMAQVQEMAPQATVAQQVMGGAPAQAPLAPAGGLGATAPAMPPMAPDMGMAPPMAPPMEAPMAPPIAPPMEAPVPGMAAGGMFEPPYMNEGGLGELPVPDTIFDEDHNGSYGGGGIVAFAGAGEARARFPQPGEYGSFIEELAVQTFPGLQVTSRQRSAAKNAQVNGVPNSFHMTGDARDFTPPEGVSMTDFAKSLKAKFGANFDVINEGDHVHVEPGSKANARMSIPERDTSTQQGMALSFGDVEGMINRRFEKSEEEKATDEAMRARVREMASPEYYEKERKDALWETLATIGFNMASSKSPRLLQAIGEAAAAALPGAAAAKKERKQLKDKALGLMVELGAKDRRDALDKFKLAQDVFQTQLAQQQFTKKLAVDERQVDLAERRLNEEIRQAGLTKPEDINDRVTRYLLDFAPGTPEHEAAKRVFEAKRPVTTGAGGAATTVRDILGGREDTSGAPAIGTIQDGFRYKGGPPGLASSWEKVR